MILCYKTTLIDSLVKSTKNKNKTDKKINTNKETFISVHLADKTSEKVCKYLKKQGYYPAIRTIKPPYLTPDDVAVATKHVVQNTQTRILKGRTYHYHIYPYLFNGWHNKFILGLPLVLKHCEGLHRPPIRQLRHQILVTCNKWFCFT